MIIHNINPILLSIGPLQIRWYGIIYALGFLITTLFLLKFSKLTKDQVNDYIFYSIIGVVIGARLTEVLIWDPVYYFSNPLKMLAIWEGGLSFHGGLIGLIIVTYLFTKKNNISFWHLADMVSIPAALGLALGRFANFINAELVGKPTNLPWCVKFPNIKDCRHPSQIYESIKNLVIFIILYFKKDHKLKEGMIFAYFILYYGIFRFIIEFVKDDLIYFGLTKGQYLSLIMIISFPFLKKYLENRKNYIEN